MSTVTLKGITYNVTARDSLESKRARGLINIVRLDEERGIAASLLLRRPRGYVVHLAHELVDGTVVYVTRL